MGFSGDLIDLNGDLMEIYPLVNIQSLLLKMTQSK